jgi:anti-sigma B factor antagonist
MTEQAGPGGAADSIWQARFEVVTGAGQQPATVRAAGDIDLACADRFRAALAEAASSGGITVDLTAVTYFDSAAIRALFSAAAQQPVTLIIPANGPITTMLTVAGLDKITTIVTAGSACAY